MQIIAQDTLRAETGVVGYTQKVAGRHKAKIRENTNPRRVVKIKGREGGKNTWVSKLYVVDGLSL